jgi:PAS domain S-box-containing protein
MPQSEIVRFSKVSDEIPSTSRVSIDNPPISFDSVSSRQSRPIIETVVLMPQVDRVWEESNRTPVLLASGAIVAIVALVDWWTKPYVSLGFLYLFPIILAAAFLPRWALVLLGFGCAALAEAFSSLEPSDIRLAFETLALAGCGLFVSELLRNRRLTIGTQARLEALVETSPAAIVTVDDRGFIELANHAASDLMAPRDGKLVGVPIAAFLPELHHALRLEESPQFRASMQCQGHRGNGEMFTANVWFSTYKEGTAHRLAAIIAETAEESPASLFLPTSENDGRSALNPREVDVIRLLVQGLANKEIAARMEISESTVKNTLQQLFAKTNVRTRAQLVRVALENYLEEL